MCVFRRVKDHHDLREIPPVLKKTCVRQVVMLDKWFPLNYNTLDILDDLILLSLLVVLLVVYIR